MAADTQVVAVPADILVAAASGLAVSTTMVALAPAVVAAVAQWVEVLAMALALQAVEELVYMVKALAVLVPFEA